MTPYDDYCAQHTTPPDEALYAVYRSVMLHTATPHMASTPYQGTLLQMLAAIIQPEVAVEIGTQAGFGAMCLARGMNGRGTLHLVEANEEYEPIIRRHAKATGLDQRLQLHIGRAADVIPILPDGIALAYIDADKENYSLYYTLLLPKMRPGGILLFDNMLWYGQVPTLDTNPSAFGTQLRRDRDIHAIHDLNQRITDDPRIDNILLPLRDGLMLCRVKESYSKDIQCRHTSSLNLSTNKNTRKNQ